MLFLEPERTSWDLHFRVFGIPVRVHPMFWVFSAVLGWSAMTYGFEFLLIWIACAFISILIHELGHVLVGRLFGSDGNIVLYSFGGLAIGSNDLRRRWQRIAVSLAGPLAGFVFLGVVVAGLVLFDPERLREQVDLMKFWLGLPFDGLLGPPTLVDVAIDDLVWINLFWGLLNLLPIWPLDGGMVSRELLSRMSPTNGIRASLGLSALVAGLLAVQAVAASYGQSPLRFPSGLYSAIFFGLLAVSSIRAMQQVRVSRRKWEEPDEPTPWERDPDWWRR